MKNTIINVETGEITEVEKTAEEIAAQNAEAETSAWQILRSRRNHLLTESDWTVMSDTPTNTAAWKTYRQALRDLPANTTDPFNVVWPTPPA